MTPFHRLVNFKSSVFWDLLLDKAHEFRMERSELIFGLIMKGWDEIKGLRKRPAWLDPQKKEVKND